MTDDRPFRFVISCEHAGNEVPERYADAFVSPGAAGWLNSHRGYDPGSLAATHQIAEFLRDRGQLFADPVVCTTTRLLIDLNRSRDNPSLFSKFSRSLSESARSEILHEIYDPHRLAVEGLVESTIASEAVAVHLSVHTFTSRIRGTWRPMEVGLLFDPDRSLERAFCDRWAARFGEGEGAAIGARSAIRGVRLRMNEPYAGTDDGLTTYLRTRHAADRYLGIELEINNRLYRRSPERQFEVVAGLATAMPIRNRSARLASGVT